MSIGFEQPVWLLALLLAIPIAWTGLRWFVSMAPVRRWSAVVVRVGLIALVAGMLAGASAVRQVDRIAVVGVIDVSGSVRRFAEGGVDADGLPMDPVTAARRFFEIAARTRGPDDLLGLVVFDGRALAVAAPSRAEVADRPIDVGLVEGTDIERALRYAAALLPPDAAGRLVLISDGVQTGGEAEEAARQLASRPGVGASGRSGLPVDVIPLAYNVTRETTIESVDAPPRAASEAAITVRVVLNSTDGGSGTLYLLREGEPLSIASEGPGPGRRLVLAPGTHVELITVRLDPGRIHRFRAVWEPDRLGPTGQAVFAGDTNPENNAGEAFTLTPGRGAVLLLDGVGAGAPTGPGATLAGTLRDAGIDVTLAPVDGLPSNLLTMQGFDLVILQNVPAEAIPPSGHDLLAAYVRDLGGGLVMVGGPDSFGAGGWKGTSVEPLLPVRLDLPERLVQPDAAIVFVLDVSGSMRRPVAGTALSQQEIANEAAALAVRSLDTKDLVGVISFSEDYTVLVALAENTDPETTGARIRSLAPGGGTNIGPALAEAGRQLIGARASLKHIIVVSDGRSMAHELLPDQARRLHEEHAITVSTISVGDQADDRTMEAMAYRGGGAFYPVTNPSLLPRFFLKAVRVVRTPLVRETPFDPVVLPVPSPLTAGVSDPPRLGGLNLTQRRPEATITYAMGASGGEPLLAHWNVELGQVAAFTSDAHQWARPWLNSGWPGYRTLWTQIARAIARPGASQRFDLTTQVQGDELRIRLDAVADDGRPLDLLTVPATIYTPSGRTVEASLAQTAPGLYEAQVAARESGNYITVAKPRQGAQRLSPVIGGASVASGVEYRRLQSNVALLRRIADTTGGRILDLARPQEARLFDRTGLQPGFARSPLWRSLLIWTLLVLLLDVATRRVAWDRLVSREFGADLRRAAAEAVSDRSEAAARAVERLRAGGRAPDWPVAGALSDEDARRVAAREAERRVKQRLAQLRAMREPPPTPSGSETAAQETPSDQGTSGLLAAKRRARERFGESEDQSESGS